MASYWSRYRKNKAELNESFSFDEISVSISDEAENEKILNLDFEHNDEIYTGNFLEKEIYNSMESIDDMDDEISIPSDASIFETDDEICGEDKETQTMQPATLREDLRDWAIFHNCTRTMVNDLLKTLREHGIDLPKDSRTLLQLQRITEQEDACGGNYKYFGLETGIIKELRRLRIFAENFIWLKANVDGIPLWKSSTAQFWPILACFQNSSVFIVALFYGKEKPNDMEKFTGDFLKELNELRISGIEFRKHRYQVGLKCIICDAPARSFLKNIISHAGYNSCERCCINGSYNGRVVYNNKEGPLRSDEGFNSYRYEKHHKGRTPFTSANIGCVSQFPLDYMHLVCLGVTRRILFFLKKGPPCCKLSSGQINQVSETLESYKGLMPSEFARQPRTLTELKRWKATELRQFLLYTGVLVLSNVLTTELYTHFLTLKLAISILVDPNEEKRMYYLPFARQLLRSFVNKSKDLYGGTFCVYNVHGLLHICDDVRNHNCSLNDISAFPFENYLQVLKKMVRNSKNPIAQVSRKVESIGRYLQKPADNPKTFKVSVKPKDSCFMVGSKVAFVKKMLSTDKFLCNTIKLKRLENLFCEPVNSNLFDIYYLSKRLKLKEKIIVRKDMTGKFVCLPFKNGHALFPLLHL